MNHAYLNVLHRTTSYPLIIFNTQYIYVHVIAQKCIILRNSLSKLCIQILYNTKLAVPHQCTKVLSTNYFILAAVQSSQSAKIFWGNNLPAFPNTKVFCYTVTRIHSKRYYEFLMVINRVRLKTNSYRQLGVHKIESFSYIVPFRMDYPILHNCIQIKSYHY